MEILPIFIIQTLILHTIASQLNQIESIHVYCSLESTTWYGNRTFNECGISNRLVVVKRNHKVKSVKITTKKVKKKLSDIDSLRIEYVVMYFLMEGFDNHLPNLTALKIGSCHLKELSKEDLKVFPKLKFLWIWENDLKVLEADLFMYNPDLIYVNFYWNYLKEIDSNIFNNFKSFEFIFLKKNDCVNFGAKNQKELKKLVEIIQQNCKPKGVEKFTKKIKNFAEKAQNLSIWFYITFMILNKILC